MKDFKFKLAGWLCRAASWLRGEKWYEADAFHGVPGNLPSELRQRIWQNAVVLNMSAEDSETLNDIDRDLLHLAQIAGESWGHVWPKKD